MSKGSDFANLPRVMSTYTIHGGDAGVKRLEFLTNATWSTSQSFLKDAGLSANMKVLEVGSAGGAITSKLIEVFQLKNQITGIDFDARAIEIAKQRTYSGLANVNFQSLDISQDGYDSLGHDFDFIYCRFVLSHLKNAQEVLIKLNRHLKSGGILAVEDTYFAGHYSKPKNWAYDRYVELFTMNALKRGANPQIGPTLPNLLKECALSNIEFKTVTPAFQDGDGKQIAILTLQGIRQSLLEAGEIDEQEYHEIETDLQKFIDDSKSILSLSKIFQCWAIK